MVIDALFHITKAIQKLYILSLESEYGGLTKKSKDKKKLNNLFIFYTKATKSPEQQCQYTSHQQSTLLLSPGVALQSHPSDEADLQKVATVATTG